MSRKNGKSPKADMKLNFSSKLMRLRGGPSTRMATEDNEENSPNKSSSSSSISPPSSCVSSEGEQNQSNIDSPEATSMVLAGCPQCLMYVMLAEHDPRCPRCKSTVLLDFNQGNNNGPSSNNKNRKR